MDNYISFRPQDARLPGYIRLSVTDKAYRQLSEVTRDPLGMLAQFSKSKVLMAVKGKDHDTVKIHTQQGTMLCKEKPDCLLIIGFYKTTLIEQNIVMKYGVCFEVSNGIIVQLRLKSPYEYYFDIVGGTRYHNKEYADHSVTASVRLIMEKTALSDEQSAKDEKKQEEPEEYKPEKRLASLLDLAENYSILSSELEEQKTNMLGNITYTGIEPVEYDRIDRVVYQFAVSSLDENVFKVGVQVAIEDKDQVRHTAEIIELVKADSDAPATAIKLLFNEQISITQFYSSGFFSLSFSTVNKDVQLAANEKIRTGEAKAKYMDAVFGTNQPAGFDRKDLSAVKAKLQQKKYPPNKSQMDAICSGINTKDVFLVMGPPGTGKTTVILEWVKYFVTQEHKRVLVSSQNNKAVDNVLARIADEKDIDVIRIGSESKLQSDVLPYMFENKVAGLRSSIVDQSESNRNTIDRLIAQWQQYEGRMDEAQALGGRVDTSLRAFQEAAPRELMPGYRQLQQLIVAHQRNGRTRRQIAEKLTTLHRRLTRHEKATNPIIRFFTGLFYKRRIAKVRRLVPQLQQLQAGARTLAARYSGDLAAWQAKVEQIRVTVYKVWQENAAAYAEALRVLKVKPARDEGDIWDFFQRSRAIDVTSVSNFAAQRQQIAADTAHARKLQDVLCTWQADMSAKQNYALNEIVLESVDLVGATCIGINSQKRFANLDFDVTIIDEAGQIQVHNALVPMSVSNKLIMLGDHKQIPPTADQELVALCEANGVSTDLLEMSLFEKMYRDLPDSSKMMLDTQYRMPAEIADTISEWFYDGKYYSPPFKKGLKSLIPALSHAPYVIIDTSREKNRRERPIPNAGCDNPLEANIIASIIRHIADTPDSDLKEIGVISAYKSQVKLIKNRLGTFLPKELVSEMAATLDSYQGQERDIILYSFTKSADASPMRRRIGFLNELRRLNVAMTRCKKMLVLIGDMEFLGGCRHCEKDEMGRDIYDKSERQFSDFINKMLGDVKNGRGELISYQEFVHRLKGGDT